MSVRRTPRHRLTCTLPSASAAAIDAALRWGVEQLGRGELRAAREAFDHVRMLAPEHPTALTMLGSIAYQEGEDALGEIYLDRAIAFYESAARDHGTGPGRAGLIGPLANLLLARNREREIDARLDPLLDDLDLPFNRLGQTAEAFATTRSRAVEQGLATVLICTVPKSASETLWNRLAAGLGLPQTHLGIGLFPRCRLLPKRLEAAVAGGLMAKEHIRPTAANLAALEQHGPSRLIVHQRDPRQAMLSWAHFVHDDVAHRPMGPIWRDLVPPASVLAGGIETVVDWSIDHALPWFVAFAAEWAALANQPRRRPMLHFSTFEQFVADADAVIDDILRFLAIPADRFDLRAAELAPDAHWRMGRTDEWRQVLDRRQRARARDALPPALASRFGWAR